MSRKALSHTLFAIACMGLALGLGLAVRPAAQAQTPADAAINPDVRLPNIRSRWVRPEDLPRPESTIEDLERCVGLDTTLRQQLAALKTRQTELEAQRQAIGTEQDAIQRSLSAVEALRKPLNDDTSAYTHSQQDMARRRTEITTLTSKPAPNAAEAKRINDMVQRFNTDLRGMETRRLALLSQQQSFNQQVAAYNARVNALNERATPWDSRWQAFLQDMKAANSTVGEHRHQCAGERTLVKPGAPASAAGGP